MQPLPLTMEDKYKAVLADPYDDRIWGSTFYAYDSHLEPEDQLKKYGWTRNEIIGVYWLRNLRRVVKLKGLSLFITIDGRHRSGKSRFAVTMACLCDKTFEKDMEHRIVRNAEQLLELVSELDRDKVDCPVIVIDEAGASLSSNDWFEKVQKACMLTLQIIGYLHPTIFFIAPVKDLILSGVRKMSHVHMKFVRSNKQYTTLIPYEIEYNTLKGKYYYKKYVMQLFGQKIIVRRVKVSLPPKEIDDRYDKFEKERKPEMLKAIHDDSKKVEIKKAREVPNIEEIAGIIAKDPSRYIAKKSKPDNIIINEDRLAMEFRLPARWARLVKQSAEELIANQRSEMIKHATKKDTDNP